MKISELKLQFISHWIYILMSLINYHSPMPIINFISTYLMVILIHFLAKKFLPEDKQALYKPLSLFLVCNSVYLNAGYDYYNFYFLHMIVLTGLLARSYFRTEIGNKPIFNPSIFGIFVIAMLFPGSATYGAYLWSSHAWQLCVVFAVGVFVTTYARTVLISLSYILTTFIMTIIMSSLFSLFPANTYASTFQNYAISLSLFSVGKFIYIFHVISDPQSAPKNWKPQLGYGAAIATVEIWLRFSGAYYSVIISYLLIQVIYKIFSDRDLSFKKLSKV